MTTSLMEQWLYFLGMQSLYAVLLGVLVWPLSRLLRGRYPHLVIGLWMLVLLRLLTPPGLASPWSARALLEPLLSEPALHLSFFEAHTGGELTGEHFGILPAGTSALPPPPSAWSLRLFALWLLGLLISGLLSLRIWHRYRSICRSASPAPPLAQALCARWKRKFAIRRPVRLLFSPHCEIPFTCGLLRPRIVLPEAMSNQRSTVLNCVLAHEMAHIQGWDSLWLTLQNLLQTVYFFNPFVWLANIAINRERELLRDWQALQAGRLNPRLYGEALLGVVTGEAVSDTFAIHPGFGGNRKYLKLRLLNIKQKRNTLMNRRRFNQLLFTALAMLLLPMAPLTSHAGIPAEQAPEKAPESDFRCPVDKGTVTSRFGMRMHPVKKEMLMHNGLDIAGDAGDPIYTVAPGLVTFSAKNGAYGEMIKIQHDNGYTSWYAQLDTRLVKKGDRVEKNKDIATMGSSGIATGPHLHLEIFKGDQRIAPSEVIPVAHLPQKDDC